MATTLIGQPLQRPFSESPALKTLLGILDFRKKNKKCLSTTHTKIPLDLIPELIRLLAINQITIYDIEVRDGLCKINIPTYQG